MRKKFAALLVALTLLMGAAVPAVAHGTPTHGHGCNIIGVWQHSYVNDGYGWYHTWYQIDGNNYDSVVINHYTRIWESPGYTYVYRHTYLKNVCFVV